MCIDGGLDFALCDVDNNVYVLVFALNHTIYYPIFEILKLHSCPIQLFHVRVKTNNTCMFISIYVLYNVANTTKLGQVLSVKPRPRFKGG